STPDGDGILHDGVFDDNMCEDFLAVIANRTEIKTQYGTVRGIPSTIFQEVRGGSQSLPVHRGSAEQSNTSLIYGDRLILKLFRREEEGPNPDTEIGKYLTEKIHFEQIPPFAGAIEYAVEGAEPSTVAMLQGLVPNEGDGWKWTLEELDRYYEACARISFTGEELSSDIVQLSELPVTKRSHDLVGVYLDAAAILGRRTAEMHSALAMPTNDPNFAPEPLTADDFREVLKRIREHGAVVLDVLRASISRLPDNLVEGAGLVLSRRTHILERFRYLSGDNPLGLRTRIHGDYHLGQVLRFRSDFIILDFEGEPARSLAERRAKQSPMKDVAGMLRSYSYAAYAALINYTTRRPEDLECLMPWARLWERSVTAEFLRSYRATARQASYLPEDLGDFKKLMEAYMLDKALYELLYELNNRPAWARIPIEGILSLTLQRS
ncbi:MAG TPA: putative maltokinase, partial [Terriglobia bacterium]|nr:putative maltokinase [Terriglobia bacterium]